MFKSTWICVLEWLAQDLSCRINLLKADGGTNLSKEKGHRGNERSTANGTKLG